MYLDYTYKYGLMEGHNEDDNVRSDNDYDYYDESDVDWEEHDKSL